MLTEFGALLFGLCLIGAEGLLGESIVDASRMIALAECAEHHSLPNCSEYLQVKTEERKK